MKGKKSCAVAKKRKPLEGVVCCVEAKNEDGSDASKETENILRALGAQVESGGIKMGLTHMIWSNGNVKMVKAAGFMDIVVVSPLWVEQCRESGQLAAVEDFLVSPDDADRIKKCSEVRKIPVPRAAHDLEDPDSFSSSQRIESKKSSGPKGVIRPGKERSTERKTKTISKESKTAKPTVPLDGPDAGKENSKNEIKPSSRSRSVTTGKTKKELAVSPSADKREHDPSTSQKRLSSNEKISSSEMTCKVSSKDKGAIKKRTQDEKVSARNEPNRKQTCPTKNSAIVALSGFDSEERGLLSDIVDSVAIHDESSENGINNQVVRLQPALPSADNSRVKAMMKMTHVVSPSGDADKAGLPVLTPSWVYASLDCGRWLLDSADLNKFLHSRFNHISGNTTKIHKEKVFVGPCVDPAQCVVEALVGCFGLTARVRKLRDADYIVMGKMNFNNQLFSFENILLDDPGRAKELLEAHSSTAEKMHFEKILQSGRILSCKSFFDCIELGAFPPKKATTTTACSGKRKKLGTGLAKAEDDEDEELMLPPSRHKKKKLKSSTLTSLHSSSSKNSNELRDSEDYSSCLVTTPEKNNPLETKESSPSENDSELSFQHNAYLPKKKAESYDSSYQSGEGSPCW